MKTRGKASPYGKKVLCSMATEQKSVTNSCKCSEDSAEADN